MIYLLVSLLVAALFHAWLFAWYFPKHCLSDRKVSWGERYRALINYIVNKIKNRRRR